MKGNSFGKLFGFTTFGESHGHYMGIVIDDVLPGVDFPFVELKNALSLRRPAQSEFSSSRNEIDDFEVISGVFEGKTTGMPICILFPNNDIRSADYDELKNVFRAGHADFSWFQKFKIYDFRGGGRASGRETISRVAAGVFVKKILGDIEIKVYPLKIGGIMASSVDFEFMESNLIKWTDPKTFDSIYELLQKTKAERDSVGALVQVKIYNVPAGLGDPVFEKLDANLAKAILSIGGVKGIEFGSGFKLSDMNGSESNLSIHQGGIAGGVSDGNVIYFNIAVKPVSSIGKPQLQKVKDSCIKNSQPKIVTIKGRHDICLVPRILPVIESMTRLVLADAIAYQDLISSTQKKLYDYREALEKIDEDIMIALYRRLEISKSIGEYKKKNNIPIYDEKREKKVFKNISDIAEKFQIPVEFAQNIWSLILKESKQKQTNL